MILNYPQIVELIKEPANKWLIDYIRSEKKKHELHITGHGLNDFLNTVDKVEDEGYIKVKKKLSNYITVKAFEKVLRPKDKILTGKGGSVLLELSDAQKVIFNQQISNVGFNGQGLNEYIYQQWLDYGIWVDPMAITLVEQDYDEIEVEGGTVRDYKDNIVLKYISVYERVNGKVVDNFHDLKFSSFDRLEYLILFLGIKDGKKYYRVIDDEKELIVERDLDRITILEQSIYFHGFGQVPGVFNSNRLDKHIENKGFTSYCKESMILADDMLNDYTDYRIYKKKLGIPRFWEHKSKCKKCNGEQRIEYDYGENEGGLRMIECPICGGTGYSKERNLTDIMQIDVLESDFQSNIPPFGAVTLPTEIQKLMRTELDEMEFDLSEVIWGQGSGVTKERQNTTAFEVSVRNESKIDKLKRIEENRIEFKRALINLIGTRFFGDEFGGVIINPNTQFMMLTPSESRGVYLESKEKKVPSYQLDLLYDNYLTAEYENNPIELERQRRIKLLTPMPHHDVIEAMEVLSPIEMAIKKNLETYIQRYEGDLVNDDLEKVQDKFKEFAKADTIEIKQKTDDNDFSNK